MAADIDKETLNTLQGLMAEDFDLLLNTYIKDSHNRIEQLRHANKEGDAEALRQAAHSFKGSCGNLGINKLAALCQQLEDLGREQQWEPVEELLAQVNAEYQLVEPELHNYLSK